MFMLDIPSRSAYNSKCIAIETIYKKVIMWAILELMSVC